jgi:hypothetical protein
MVTKFFEPQLTLLNFWNTLQDYAWNALATIHNLMTHMNNLKYILNMFLHIKIGLIFFTGNNL